MSLYNIDENKNMVLNALFAPYDMNPTFNLNTIEPFYDFSEVGSYIDGYISNGTITDSVYLKFPTGDTNLYMIIRYGNDGTTSNSPTSFGYLLNPQYTSPIWMAQPEWTPNGHYGVYVYAYIYRCEIDNDKYNVWIYKKVYYRIIRIQ